ARAGPRPPAPASGPRPQPRPAARGPWPRSSIVRYSARSARKRHGIYRSRAGQVRGGADAWRCVRWHTHRHEDAQRGYAKDSRSCGSAKTLVPANTRGSEGRASVGARERANASEGTRGRGRTERPTAPPGFSGQDRKSTRLNSSHVSISYAVFCLKKKNL